MEFNLSLVIGGVLILIWFVYSKLNKNSKFFEERGIAYEKPIVVAGNNWHVLSGKESLFVILQRLYNKFYDEKIFGYFNFTTPMFMVTDPELIKQITIKNFDNFMNHDKTFDEQIDKIFGRSLVALYDEKWRVMRNSLSPLFTSSKMKMMFETVSECAQDFVVHFERKSKNGKVIIDAQETFARYTVDGISTAALGFKGDCIENEDSALFVFAQSLTVRTFVANLKFLLVFVAKPIYIFLKLKLTTKEFVDFFRKAIVDVMNDRESKGTFRPDLIQLLIQLKKGKVDKRDKEDGKDLKNFSANIEYDVGVDNSKTIKWVDEDFMAQGFIFFGAGFDTTKNLLQTLSYELVKNPKVQEELLEEVDAVLSTMDGRPVSYEAVHKMKFLDQVISESLRFWPPAMMTNRECNKDCQLDLGNGKTVMIKKGEGVMIPIGAIHRDKRNFENPDTFDPHRFDDDKKDLIAPGSYIPFGYGPRVCIGSRFALMEAKLLIFNILSKFTIEACDKTPKALEFSTEFGVVSFKEKIFVELKPRLR